MTLTSYGTRIDVRAIPPRDRHTQIFATFRSLGAGESMEIVNDHDPRPLYAQFDAQAPAGFAWTYLEQGPDTWRVRIDKLAATSPQAGAAPAHGNGSCCGGCGGCGGH